MSRPSVITKDFWMGEFSIAFGNKGKLFWYWTTTTDLFLSMQPCEKFLDTGAMATIIDSYVQNNPKETTIELSLKCDFGSADAIMKLTKPIYLAAVKAEIARLFSKLKNNLIDDVADICQKVEHQVEKAQGI